MGISERKAGLKISPGFVVLTPGRNSHLQENERMWIICDNDIFMLHMTQCHSLMLPPV